MLSCYQRIYRSMSRPLSCLKPFIDSSCLQDKAQTWYGFQERCSTLQPDLSPLSLPRVGHVFPLGLCLCCFLCSDTFSHLVVWRNFYSTLQPLSEKPCLGYHVGASLAPSICNNHGYHICSVRDMQYWPNPDMSLASLSFYARENKPRG